MYAYMKHRYTQARGTVWVGGLGGSNRTNIESSPHISHICFSPTSIWHKMAPLYTTVLHTTVGPTNVYKKLEGQIM